jgi:secreted trypsin-like serine protease
MTNPAEGGRSNITQTSRIVGGTGAPQGKYPYFVQWDRGCGASLIHSDILLTAAHCDGTNIPTGVIVGAYQNGQATFGAQARQVVERSRHPKYSSFDRCERLYGHANQFPCHWRYSRHTQLQFPSAS